MQTCNKCEVEQELKYFHKLASGKGYYKTCKSCSDSRTCSKCREELPLTSFQHLADGEGYFKTCKKCNKPKKEEDEVEKGDEKPKPKTKKVEEKSKKDDELRYCPSCENELPYDKFKSVGRGYSKLCLDCGLASADVTKPEKKKLILLANMKDAYKALSDICKTDAKPSEISKMQKEFNSVIEKIKTVEISD